MASRNRILEFLYCLFKKDLMNDIAFIGGSDGICYPAHKPLLACCSEYFRDLFKQREDDDNLQTFMIEDIDPHSLVQCIDYVYTGTTNISDDNLENLLQASRHLKMHDIYEECINYAISSMNLSTFHRISKLSKEYPSERLQRATEMYALSNFLGLSYRMDFEKLDLATVFTLLKSDRIQAIPERVVYQAVMVWVQYDLPIRRSLLPELMKYVRFEKLPIHFMKQSVCTNDVIMGSSACRDMVEDALFSHLAEDVSCPDGETTLKQRQLVLFDRVSGKVKTYDPWDASWGDLPYPRSSEGKYAAIAVGQVVYVFGEDGKVQKLDGGDTMWIEMEEMHEKRCDIRLEHMDGLIYVCGGTSPTTGKGMRAAERFDPVANKWEKLSSMKKPRTKHCIASSLSHLYAIGGLNNNNSPLKLVERWSGKTTGWANIAPLKQPRSGATCVVKDESIYIMGGTFTADVTVEILKAGTNVWTALPLCIPKSFIAVCAVGDDMYVVSDSGSKGGGKYEIQMVDLEGGEPTVVETVQDVAELQCVLTLG